MSPGWPVHPAAELFPLMEGGDLRGLAEDIRVKGLSEPVTIYGHPDNGIVLLDGRNRLAACEMAGVEPTTRRYTGEDPIGFVMSANLQRRHLTVGQRAALACDVLPLYEAEAKERKGGRPPKQEPRAELPAVREKGRARERAAAAVGVADRALAQYKRVATADPGLAAKVRAGAMPVDTAEKVIKERERLNPPTPAPKRREPVTRVRHDYIDPNRVVQEMVHVLDGLVINLDYVTVGELDRSRIEEWATSMDLSLQTLKRFTKEMTP